MSLKDDLNEKKEQLSKSIDETKDNIVEEYNEVKEKLGEEIDDAKEAVSKTVKTGVKKTKSFFKWLLGFIIIGLILTTIGYFLYCNWTYSEGTRTGQLIKVSKKGYIFKTYEGQLNMGGITGNITDGTLGTVWEFSLKDDELYKELESLEGQKVQLRYKEINKSMPWQGDTNYFIYDVEVK